MYRKLTTVAAVAALTLGLAACGGGGDGDDTADAPTTMEPTGPTPDEQIAALQADINALRAELGLDPVDIEDLTGSVSDLEGQVADLTQQIADRDKADADAEAEAKAKENATVGRLLHAALGPPAASVTLQNALGNIASTTLSPAGLTVTAADGAGTVADGTTPPAVTLTAGDSAGSLGSWAGTMYSHTQGSGPSKITNEAVVYNNRGAHAGPSRPFAEAYAIDTGATVPANRGYHALTLDAATYGRVRGDAFTHSGIQTHSYPRGTNQFTARGTYDGAPGEFRCTGTDACTSTNDGKAGPSLMTGTWHFKPDVGAMTSPADANYLYYGWWVRKDADDEPTSASAFAGIVGDVDGTGTTTGGDALTGSATYEGHAAGKFAIHRTADGSNNGGHFTADAELTAKFGAFAADNSNGMKGTIDNFRLNDGSDDPGWSVSLNRSAWGADGAITGTTTVWSINGNKAAAGGSWSGQMYDETPGAPPAGDGSTVPTTVTGTFYSVHGSTHRMVGGFAAEKQ